MTQPHLVEVNRYRFSTETLTELETNAYAAGNWPLVYILSDGTTRCAYVGETTDTLARLGTHLKHPQKKSLTTVHLVSSERFNKSATLDIESSLIKYMSADGRFSMLNGNLGLSDHNYYQRNELYSRIFRETWDRLREHGIAERSIEAIDNSDVFKYSPYKSLSTDQRQGLIEIMRSLVDPELKHAVVQGGAGTGKSVLAIFLFKLIHSDLEELDLREFSEEEKEVRELLQQIKQSLPNPRMALVVPMSSFRSTLKKAFKNVAGLRPNMVISPSELTKQRYDIVLVDESHRLRKRVNLGTYFRNFDAACAALGMDKNTCSEVDWVTRQSDKAVFFYDPDQSIKPSDADASDFEKIKSSARSTVITLTSQFRARGGQHYVRFVDDLLHMRLPSDQKFSSSKYEFLVFDELSDMVREIQQRNASYGLTRLVAGYAWPWISKKSPELHDIEIGDIRLRWNSTTTDWINTKDTEDEVGCIHTTQGYDLNYTGVIFGREIRYDEKLDQIVIDRKNYHDRNGKQTIEDPNELKKFVLNIYRTLMLRGIRGTFLYACDDSLRGYLKRHVESYRSNVIAFPTPGKPLEPYVNAVPLYDLRAAAGGFSALQQVGHENWVAVPDDMPVGDNIFACHVVGESMNKVIPDGAISLFRSNPGGSRNGKIVLVECADTQDGDAGSRYTVKEYQSFKVRTEDGAENQKILLKPRSTNPALNPIELSKEDDEHRYRVVGEFLGVIG
ncbi:DNA/RNA helicase domain-containing protein [Achromobacter xylosoxidans]|uniref:DNA/RNA helicase domain-containing protein n=1 Tax=Alcaligenes xylosoxydans xylosoxydans TaxID=85698 RepID=UPI001F145E91|nr:DNA/RNA helicase domain-containing protein [Achromobacter xylosoxidans]